MKKLLQWIAICSLSLSAISCLQTEVKVLGDKSVKFGTDTTTPESFRFNFASQDQVNGKLIYLQGGTNTKTAMITTCNSSGKNCVCEFLDQNGLEIEETTSARIAYDIAGNYFRCQQSTNNTNLVSVRIRNQNGTIISANYTVLDNAEITAQDILGSDLDLNQLRGIFRYECLHTYMQKTGTTTSFFDCRESANLCSPPGGSPGGDLCLLRTYLPYYLYSDGTTNNHNKRIPESLYNGGNTCGLSLREFDCATTASVPVAQFGIYKTQSGNFDTAIRLSAGPNQTSETYGYAARVSSVTLEGDTSPTLLCPPGMVQRIFYSATTSTAALGNSNYPNASEVAEIGVRSTPPTSLAVQKLYGGICENDTGICSMPAVVQGNIENFSYTIPSGQEVFCVIPSRLLP